ncbi:type IV secretory system conjugative DNA transfer family protein [Glycomyces salinus]|uniref:type IV secretory system conjugative DNA transfer family protein n=1 Tax=Glycomyces salinus TaxID=980294 RepID=UPI0018ECCCCE|nr:type IV secretory system conjugative DNA transfer family protein [Glycomyces salinus]
MSSGKVRFVGTGGDALLLIGAVIVLGSGLWVWLTGQVAGLLFGFTWINVGLEDLVAVVFALPSNITDPAAAWPEFARPHLPGPLGFAAAAALAAAVITAGIVAASKLYARLGGIGAGRGMASGTQLDRKLSAAAALKKAKRLRPNLDGRASVDHVAVDLGKAAGVGRRLAADIENSVLVLAAPRQGKTSQVVIPWLAHWQGPALATSVRPDIVEATYTFRENIGPVAVLDVSDTVWPEALKWSPVVGCEDYDKARRRAKVMVTVGRLETADSTNAGFFQANATNLLAGWLHAAALGGRGLDDVAAWALDETNMQAAVILEAHPGTAPGVEGNLDGLYNLAPETRSSLFATVQTALAPMLSTRARAVFSPSRSEHFDIETFLRKSGTVFLLVPQTKASELAPLISAFVDEVTETATALATENDSGRLDPPLGMFLDEVANIAPLERLPDLMSYSAGSGIFITAILQELAQARARWGNEGADMLWGASTIKIALGGLTGDEAERFSKLAGKWWEDLPGIQYGPHGVTHAPRDRDREVITASQIRELDADKGEALIIAGGVKPVKTRITRHYKSGDAKTYAASVKATRARLNPGAAVNESPAITEPGGHW